ncbi:glycogen synthase [Saprospira grandis DSM 2844]|uniref:starch synthase n=1 Tax=Saprospira grandis DSM 2844 TaxID=694433 RepID=J0P6C4_9BACT|nr:glycogen/starch synthase [Saprospira grandis]EJF53022.1 glycogen synthase [Saprospira grandis DSM 2844]
MADKKRILVVSQAFKPYTTASEIAEIARQYTQYIQEQGAELRILMPRYGLINERRHRLHEVVRLSGMNINVSDEDYPLLIKVASLPGTRMQVYFLDNDDFFKRKQLFLDKDEQPFEDNMSRMTFFCKGVIETVKKFGWAPDLIHCHGWMSSLLPAYLKNHYKNEPIFQDSQLVYSAYPVDEKVQTALAGQFAQVAADNQLSEEEQAAYMPEGQLDLNAGAIAYADAFTAPEEMMQKSDKASFCCGVEKDAEAWGKQWDFFQDLLKPVEENA